MNLQFESGSKLKQWWVRSTTNTCMMGGVRVFHASLGSRVMEWVYKVSSKAITFFYEFGIYDSDRVWCLWKIIFTIKF